MLEVWCCKKCLETRIPIFKYYPMRITVILGKNKICKAGLAQSVERGTFNPEVKGSSPLFGVLKFCLLKKL